MKQRVIKKQKSRRFQRARTWMRRHTHKYDRGFDMADVSLGRGSVEDYGKRGSVGTIMMSMRIDRLVHDSYCFGKKRR